MRKKTLTKQYALLTPEERCHLIMAASGRGDAAERDRLVRAGGRITLSVQDHIAFGHAFESIALMAYLDVLDESAAYIDAFVCVDHARPTFADEEGRGEADNAAPDDEESDSQLPDNGAEDILHSQRSLELVFATGYILRTKAHGWNLFCERRHVPPDLLWQHLPGFKRLERALCMTEKAAFSSEEFLRWMNSDRPAGQPALTRVPLTEEAVAESIEEAYGRHVSWWGGG